MRPVGKKYQESVSNFIEKTYNILDNEQNSQIVSWTPKGLSFIIKDVKKFEEYILPIYFKHSNFSSFVRQLNMYNFHKVRGDRLDCEFEHEKFKKGHRDLLCRIKRKQSQSFIVSQNIIDDHLGNLSLQDSSDNVKKYSEPHINFDFLSKDQPKLENVEKSQTIFEELENLKKQNKTLKMIKQARVQKQKSLNTSTSSLMGQKFFKLITCLLAQKLQKQLHVPKPPSPPQSPQKQRQKQRPTQKQKQMNFDQIIEHILSNSQSALQFSKYSQTAKTLSSQQSDYDFMVRKAHNTSHSFGQGRSYGSGSGSGAGGSSQFL